MYYSYMRIAAMLQNVLLRAGCRLQVQLQLQLQPGCRLQAAPVRFLGTIPHAVGWAGAGWVRAKRRVTNGLRVLSPPMVMVSHVVPRVAVLRVPAGAHLDPLWSVVPIAFMLLMCSSNSLILVQLQCCCCAAAVLPQCCCCSTATLFDRALLELNIDIFPSH